MGKFDNNHFKDLRILGFILIFFIVCGIILEIIADNDGCGMNDNGGLGCLGYGFAWVGCLFFVVLTVLLSIIPLVSILIQNPEVGNTVESVNVDSEDPTDIIEKV